MNHKILFIIYFLLTISIKSQNYQSVEVTYGLISAKIETNKDQIKNKDLFEDVFEIQELLEYTLKANKKGVVFYNNFTESYEERENTKIKISNKIFGFDTFEYEKDKDSLFFIKGNYKVYVRNNKKWIITDSVKVINNIKCLLAIGTYVGLSKGKLKTYSCKAWFAPEISYNFGPDGITNLPGLVLEYEKGKKKIVAKKIDFLENEIKLDLKKYKIISEEDYSNSMPNKP